MYFVHYKLLIIHLGYVLQVKIKFSLKFLNLG